MVTFENNSPLSFTFRRPGSPISSVLPSDLYFNILQQPGINVPGATFTQKIPSAGGKLNTKINYFGHDPQHWGATLEPGISTMPQGTTAELNTYPDLDQEEDGKAFSNPVRKAFELPGFSHLPGLKESFDLSFNPSMPSPPGSELVYVQVPAINGKYYFCPGVTMQQFLSLTRKEEAAKLCGIPLELLDADIMVVSFSPVCEL